jgi:hypothetical protein
MSYVRFGEDGSHMYVFMAVGSAEHPGGWLECCSCWLQVRSYQAFSTAEMVEHLRMHVVAGDCVRDHVIPSRALTTVGRPWG